MRGLSADKKCPMDITRRGFEHSENIRHADKHELLQPNILKIFVVVAEWYTRTFEGRVERSVRVQVPPTTDKKDWGLSPKSFL